MKSIIEREATFENNSDTLPSLSVLKVIFYKKCC